jgi:hypothetical protein
MVVAATSAIWREVLAMPEPGPAAPVTVYYRHG